MVSPYHRYRPGYTLIELLVVVMIAILLMVISLPVAKTVMDDARPREAARILNTTIYTAKARAGQSGNLAGIEFVLQRMNDPMAPQGAFQCTQMYMCEVPALYMGDTIDARAMVDNMGTITFSSGSAAALPTLLDSSKLFEIRFNHRGLWYPVQYNSGTYRIQNAASLPPPAIGPNGAAFHIRRPPVRVGNPVELPKSTAIDMTVSGVGPIGTEFGTVTPPLRIMFAPAGNVYFPQGAPLGTIHFLVGLTTKVNVPLQANPDHASNLNLYDPNKSNLADNSALWVSIGRNSGVVTTNENAAPPYPTVTNPTSTTGQQGYLRACREYAINRTQKGGL